MNELNKRKILLTDYKDKLEVFISMKDIYHTLIKNHLKLRLKLWEEDNNYIPKFEIHKFN